MLQKGFSISADDPALNALRASMLEFYLKDISALTQPYPGIKHLIQQLANHQIKWGIVTNKPWLFTEPLMNNFNFATAPSCIICPDHVSKPKPSPEPILLACKQTSSNPSEVFYIGDHKRDIDSGINANVKTIAARYGYLDQDDNIEEWNADYVIDHAKEIWPIIEKHII